MVHQCVFRGLPDHTIVKFYLRQDHIRHGDTDAKRYSRFAVGYRPISTMLPTGADTEPQRGGGAVGVRGRCARPVCAVGVRARGQASGDSVRYNQGTRRLGSAGRFVNADCSLGVRCELRSIPPARALTANSSGRSVPLSPSAKTLRSMWPRS